MLNRRMASLRGTLLAALGLSLAGGCGGDDDEGPVGLRGGASGQGGAPRGGAAQGGMAQGGALQGGRNPGGAAGHGGEGASAGETGGSGGLSGGDGGGGTGGGGGETGGHGGATSGSGGDGGAGGAGSGIVSCDRSNLAYGFAWCSQYAAHRPTQQACPVALDVWPGAGGANGGGGAGGEAGASSCSRCEEDTYGSCVESMGEKVCWYGCRVDADCRVSQICLCNGPKQPGVCSPATCVTNADCTVEGELCLGTGYPDPCTGLPDFSFSCRKPSETTAGPLDPEVMCGRPFLIAGEPCLAELVWGSGWSSVTAVEQKLWPNQSATLSEHWGRIALMEHASVAAFARFVLDLLALGAPAELVQASQRALGDEITHAELCFTLASRYAGQPLGPSALDTTGALTATSLVECALRAFEEACIGETLAVAEAAAALDVASDEQVRATLARIVEDESRHAELGYRFVAWALQRCNADETAVLRAKLSATVLRVLASEHEPSDQSLAISDDAALCAHGLLPERFRRAARRMALTEVVSPCAGALGLVLEETSARAA